MNTRGKFFVAALALIMTLGVSACSPTGGNTTEPPPSPTPTPQEPALALDDLLTADVPELCEHPAGTLVNGALPGIAQNEGQVNLDPRLIEDINGGAGASEQGFIGEDAAGETFIAASVYCDKGGVAWPGRVVMWNGDLEPVAVWEPESITHGDRESIFTVTSTDGGFTAQWTAPAAQDASCCLNISAQGSFTVDVAAGTVIANGEPTLGRGETQLAEVFQAAIDGEPAPAITLEEGMYDGILNLISTRGAQFDVAGIQCADAQAGMPSTLACAVPTTINGQTLSYIAYPQRDGDWGHYSFTRELELF